MNRAQQLLDEMSRPKRKQVPAQPAAPAPQELMNPKEMEDFALTALGWGDMIKMMHWIENGLYVDGRVTRISHHYSHENTVSFELEVTDMDSFPEEEQAEIEKTANEAEKRISDEVKTTSRKIYRALEREWDWRLKDETVEEDIRANDYDFTAEGEREEGGGFKFDQLDDFGKEKAREWMRQCHYEDPDTFWSEHIIDEWKTELEEMGFNDPDISWSGFSSQGDGASFTCKSFELPKFAKFFMSGHAEERGHPYSDEKYENADGHLRESEDLGIDMNDFTQDVIYQDFSAFAEYDSKHENWNNPGEKHYLAQKMADDTKFMVRLNIFDGMKNPDKQGYVRVELTAQGWSRPHPAEGRRLAGNVSRKVKLFIPAGRKPRLVSMLFAYWQNAQGVADRRNAQGEPPDPEKMCRSLAYRLSMLAGQWKKEVADEHNAHLDAQAKAFMDAMTPEQKAALEKKREEWIAKHPEPSEEKLKLRAEMRKWKAERDAAAAAVPPPQQESEDDELLQSMGDVATRGSVNTIGSFMRDQPVRYMSGAQHYNWSKTTSCWAWKLDVDAYVFDDNLPDQPWEVGVKVHSCLTSSGTRRLDHTVRTDQEKNFFGINLKKFIDKMEEIVERAWRDDEYQLLREIEIAFNSTMVPRGPGGRSIETFYTI